MTHPPHHLRSLLEAAHLKADPDCLHIECGHLVRAEQATDELARAVPALLSVFEAACAWRDAKSAAFDAVDECACDNAIHDTTNAGECPQAEAEWSLDQANENLIAAIDLARSKP